MDSKDNRKEAVSYFKISEFDSKDGAEMPSSVKVNVIELIDNLNVLRQELGSPLYVNSGYRSPEHNKNIGGSINSQHLTGKAADIRSNEYTPKQIKEKIIHYGDSSMKDYTQHGSEKRRKSYCARSAGIKGGKGKMSANTWARKDLWSC